MKVAIYARYSTTEQDRTSIDGQVANCKMLAERDNLTIAATFCDEGISGNDDERPAYREMIGRLEAGEFDGVLADETSRLTRNLSQLATLIDDLEFRDQFLLTFDGVDSRNESATMIVAVKSAMDRMEGRKVGNRVYRSNRERHLQGYSTGGRIYGYESVDDGDYKRRVVVPDQAEVIVEIFERYSAGESPKSIVRDFNRRGIPSPGSLWSPKSRRCQGWTHSTLTGSYTKASGILRNPIYTGRVVWNKRKNKKVPRTGRKIQNLRTRDDWIVHEDESLRIMPDELFDVVQARLADIRRRHKVRNTGGRPSRYLFSGILKCGSCGANYAMANARYYRCTSQTNGRDVLCDQKKGIDKSLAETELLADIKAQLLAPGFVKEIARTIRKQAKKEATPRKRSSAKRRDDLERQIANVVDTLATVGKSAALTEKLKALETERAALTPVEPKSRPTQLIVGADDVWQDVVTNLEVLHKYASADEVAGARDALKGIIGEITVCEEGDEVVGYPSINNDLVYKVVPRRGLEPPRGYPH